MSIRILFTITLLFSLTGLSEETAKKSSDCDIIVQDVRDICNEIEDDYHSEVADHLEEISNSKEMTSQANAARKLRKVRLTEATAARDYARECKAELDTVPTSCRTHGDYVELAEEVKKAKDSATDFELEASKLQKIANSVSKSPEIRALKQLVPGLLDVLSGNSSPIMKAGVKPSLPRAPAGE